MNAFGKSSTLFRFGLSRSMAKYLTVYHLGLSRALVYRTNLLLGAVNIVIWFGTLILLYKSLGGSLGSYSTPELVTYILGASFLSALLFNSAVMDNIANEIVEGDLVNYLLQPVNYFYYWLARSTAMRTPLIVISLIVVFFLSRVVSSDVIIQTDLTILAQTALLSFGSIVMMTALDFLAGMFSFWTDRGFGARWALMISSRFLSGAALPIALMPIWAQAFFKATPFPYLISAPVEAYLGHVSGSVFAQTVIIQWAWIIATVVVVALVWQRGLKRYAAYGT